MPSTKPKSKQTAAAATVQDPGRVRDLAASIVAGRLSPVELVQRYLDRIAAIDGQVHAWREVDGSRALAAARLREAEAKAGRIRGSLHGIPVAIKDIIDVEGLPTRANSRSRDGIAPATCDAEIVASLRRQGAIVLGKVHTTEFAFFDPSPACNPHNLAHTPGGSSSGSAAAVAAGMAPFAIGTQTVASVNRPGAYCGVAAFKPSTRSMPGFGITPLAPMYDTAGTFGWSVDDAVHAYEAIAPWFAANWPMASASGPIKVAVVLDSQTDDATADVKASVRTAAAAMATAGHAVVELRSPISLEGLADVQRSTMLYETGRTLRGLLDHPRGQVGAKLLEAIHEGLDIPMTRYLDERAAIDQMRSAFFAGMEDVDVFLYPATPDTAPKGLAWTGDRRYIAPWTAFGGPVVSMPAGKAANGLPVACLLAGRPGADRQVTVWARRLAECAERH